jgi:hypothetical protein
MPETARKRRLEPMMRAKTTFSPEKIPAAIDSRREMGIFSRLSLISGREAAARESPLRRL